MAAPYTISKILSFQNIQFSLNTVHHLGHKRGKMNNAISILTLSILKKLLQVEEFGYQLFHISVANERR